MKGKKIVGCRKIKGDELLTIKLYDKECEKMLTINDRQHKEM